ncbi:hypothetical protein LCGC14_1579580 [marine sediment metagenome]|uniref:DNA methylase N-4/N-6 domain-containing protein n=1 Tax=marine sediment metagenome TaxID=412755 RepID=A0A0F9KY79_9ZZZZ
MAYGLLKRILDHCKDEGWGGVIVDPFGGIGSTGILGAYDGYMVICVELEQKFVELAKQNFELHRNAFEEFGCPYPVIIQGDSRKLCSVIEESVELIISSPPFQGAHQGGVDSTSLNTGACKRPWLDKATENNGYGQTPGQLGSMKAGKVDMVISSPPYAETPVECTHRTSNKRGDESDPNYRPSWTRKLKEGYDETKRPYGQTKGNLGNLKAGDVDLVVSSPPYEGSLANDTRKTKNETWQGKRPDGSNRGGEIKAIDYGKGKGQLGQEQGPTFWQAAKEIVQQCHKILKPGGHAIFVCKDFVRKGKRVPFSDDWQRLCESVGFKTIHRHKAMLVKEDVKDDLFGGKIVKKTERKSFFRRLAEAKGSPKIDWEDVICMEK